MSCEHPRNHWLGRTSNDPLDLNHFGVLMTDIRTSSSIAPYSSCERDMSRYERDTASARLGANIQSIIPITSVAASLGNRIEADARNASLANWECAELERLAATLEGAVMNIRAAARSVQHQMAAE